MLRSMISRDCSAPGGVSRLLCWDESYSRFVRYLKVNVAAGKGSIRSVLVHLRLGLNSVLKVVAASAELPLSAFLE